MTLDIPHGHIGTCSSSDKRQYDSRRAARQAAKSAHPGDRLQAYRCDACGFWHYGHPRQTRRRARPAGERWSA